MSLTADDVRSVAFKRSAIGRRGYDEEEVDTFLERVEEELNRLVGQPPVSPGQPDTHVPAAAATAPADPDGRFQVIRLLQAAEETANRLTDEATSDSERRLADARQQAEKLIAEATERAAAIDQEARIGALALEKKAQDSHDQILGGLAQRRAALEQDVEKLQTYRQEMHRQMQDVIHRHLALLEQDDNPKHARTTPAEGNFTGDAAQAA